MNKKYAFNIKKALITIGIAGLALLGTGCQKKVETVQEDASTLYDPVTLNMYLVGDEPADADLVYAELNKLMQEDLNAQLVVNFISWSDYEQKYPLIMASGVGVDMIYTADWCFYDSEARKGAFHEITQADIDAYMPLTAASQPKSSFEQAKIDGKIYMVPNNQNEYATYKIVEIRGDLRKKYGLGEIKTIEDLTAYYDAVLKNNPELLPYGASSNNEEIAMMAFWQKNNLIPISSGLNSSPFAIQYKGMETDYKLIDVFEMPEYWQFIEEMKNWRDKGYWSANAVSNTVSAQSLFEEGKSASLIWNLGTLALSYTKIMQTHPEWEPEIVDLTPNAVRTIAKYTNNGIAIAAQSGHYDRALMLLDRLKNDERYWNLTWLGIEGRHWERVDSNIYRELPQASQYSYAATSCWGWGNVPFQKTSVDAPKENQYFQKVWLKSTVTPKTEFFRFNDAKVKTQLVACQGVLDKYQVAFELGMSEDQEQMKALMTMELEKAGWPAVKAEFTQQYQAFIQK